MHMKCHTMSYSTPLEIFFHQDDENFDMWGNKSQEPKIPSKLSKASCMQMSLPFAFKITFEFFDPLTSLSMIP